MALGDVVVRAGNVKKDFHLPHHKSNSIKHSIVNAFKKKDKDVDVHHALKGVSFEVREGEFFGIVGRNGSGKSTMLKIIAEIYRPKSGKVWHRGKLVSFIELGVGFNGELTGRENIYLNGALLGFSRKEIDERYDEIVAFSELEEFMDQKLKNYSSGMKVRLAFSVATHAEADILLLDEVLAVGDAAFQRKCYDYFKDLKKRKKTIIFVSHSMSAVREYCDRAILIEEGQVAHEGTADEVADEYLKLFNAPSDTTQQTSKRWGDQSVVMENFKLTYDKKKLDLYVDLVAADKAMDDVKFGFQIKDKSGKLIAGANNLNVEGAQKLNFRPHEKKSLHFAMPNIFGKATYVISGTVIAEGGSIVCDKWDEITSFSAPKDQVFYPVVCPAKLTVTK